MEIAWWKLQNTRMLALHYCLLFYTHFAIDFSEWAIKEINWPVNKADGQIKWGDVLKLPCSDVRYG